MNSKLRVGTSIAALTVVGVMAGFVLQGASHGTSVGTQRKVIFYQDSMHPWVKSDRPGKCTICDMDLTPIHEGQSGFGGENIVVLSSNQVTVLNVQTEPVKRLPLGRSLRVAGTLDANETSKTVVSAPARGRIDALAVDYAGVEVEQGQKLITMFSPELVQLRKTLLTLRQSAESGGTNGLPRTGIDPGVYTGDILAPQSGMVLERNVYNGQYVTEGDRLLTIVDASVLWFRFDVYQRQLPWFEPGQTIDVEVSGIPGKVFPAVISFVEPTFNEATRTVKVRADMRNPLVEVNGHRKRLLKYGMYAEGLVRVTVPEVLAVPRTAVLFPGGAAYAYVDKGGGAYERRRVKLGREGDQLWEVLKGLEEGERVVTSGNMLIDAQAQFNLVAGPEEKDAGEPALAEVAPPHDAGQKVMNHPDDIPRMEAKAADGMAQPMIAASSIVIPGREVARPSPAVRHAAAARTDRMVAVMSPGGELQSLRRAAILRELAMKTTNAEPVTPGLAQPAPAMSAEESTPRAAPATDALASSPDPASQVRAPSPAQTPTNQVLTYAQADAMRRATVAQMKTVRAATIAEANKQKATPATALTDPQRQLLQAFLAEADGVSQALAADDLERFSGHIAKLPALVKPLPDALSAQHPLNPLLQRLAAIKWQSAKDLVDARKQFLPFSTALVDFARQLRKQDQAFAGLKIYHCPMAPEPGLWLQAKAPLANPFYGAKMLRCGEEVTP